MGGEQLVLVSLACVLAFAAAQAPPLQYFHIRPGFQISTFAYGVERARQLAISKANPFIVYTGSNEAPGAVHALVDRNRTGLAEPVLLLSGLNAPNGVAWHNGSLFVGEINRITRYDNADDHVLRTNALPNGTVIDHSFPNNAWHGHKVLQVDPGNGLLHVPLGAPCNDCPLDIAFGNISYGGINRMATNGSGIENLAVGIRNTVGYQFHPATGDLIMTNNGCDQLGDNAPDDTLIWMPMRADALVTSATNASGLANFGFPYCHWTGAGSPVRRALGAGSVTPDPDNAPPGFEDPADHLQWCQDTARKPIQALGPHIAALGMIIYQGGMFPARFRGSVFIAQHGSWARSQRIGYRVGVVTLGADHRTSVGYDAEFLTGFLLPNNTIWGRPVDLAELPDGSILLSDDFFGAVYRITWSRNGRVPPIQYFPAAGAGAAEAPSASGALAGAPDQAPAGAGSPALAPEAPPADAPAPDTLGSAAAAAASGAPASSPSAAPADAPAAGGPVQGLARGAPLASPGDALVPAPAAGAPGAA